MKKLFITLLLGMAVVTNVNAQKVKLVSGRLGMLSGVEKINVEYDYSRMGVGKFKNEKEYVKKKKSDYNEKESGRGDKWEESWVGDRARRFEPKFEDLFTQQSGITAGDFSDAKYTLIFKTTFTEPGYNIGISRKNAEIDGQAWIVETANRSRVLAKISVENSQGRIFGGYDYDTGVRIQEAYAMAGKGLGTFIKKQIKKSKK